MKPARETITPYIALDWYDGPLLEIARVDFSEPRPAGSHKALIQVCTFASAVPDEEVALANMHGRGAVHGEYPWTRATIRLSREDLVKMLDLIDGKPVKDYNDERR